MNDSSKTLSHNFLWLNSFPVLTQTTIIRNHVPKSGYATIKCFIKNLKFWILITLSHIFLSYNGSCDWPLREKVSKYGVFSGPYFPVFGLNTEKYGPDNTSYLDTFHAVGIGWKHPNLCPLIWSYHSKICFKQTLSHSFVS